MWWTYEAVNSWFFFQSLFYFHRLYRSHGCTRQSHEAWSHLSWFYLRAPSKTVTYWIELFHGPNIDRNWFHIIFEHFLDCSLRFLVYSILHRKAALEKIHYRNNVILYWWPKTENCQLHKYMNNFIILIWLY